MQTNTSTLASSLFVSNLRFAPPAHVKRWTGRAALTIPLPSLANLRLGQSGGGAPAQAGRA